MSGPGAHGFGMEQMWSAFQVVDGLLVLLVALLWAVARPPTE